MTFDLLIGNAALVLVLMTALWAVSVFLKDASIVDPWWSIGFLLVTAHTVARTGLTPGKALLLAMVGAWAVRLWLYLLCRSRGKAEDPRYAGVPQEVRRRAVLVDQLLPGLRPPGLPDRPDLGAAAAGGGRGRARPDLAHRPPRPRALRRRPRDRGRRRRAAERVPQGACTRRSRRSRDRSSTPGSGGFSRHPELLRRGRPLVGLLPLRPRRAAGLGDRPRPGADDVPPREGLRGRDARRPHGRDAARVRRLHPEDLGVRPAAAEGLSRRVSLAWRPRTMPACRNRRKTPRPD